MKTINENLTAEVIKGMGEEIDLYRLIAPMWYTVNIYGTHEEYLKSAKDFTLEQRYLLALQWYTVETDNGGHHQFFSTPQVLCGKTPWKVLSFLALMIYIRTSWK